MFRAAAVTPELLSDDAHGYEEALQAIYEQDHPDAFVDHGMNGDAGPSSDWSVHAGASAPPVANGKTMSSKAKGKQRAIDVDEDMDDDLEGDDATETAQLRQLDAEMASIEDQIADLRALYATLQSDRDALVKKRKARPTTAPATVKPPPTTGKVVDYTKSDWSWSTEILKMAKEVWGIKAFRSLQEGVMNAVLDGRDVMCIMPTGAGKSLCFQLPALVSDGTTVVISPLIALMHDQVLNLREKGVEAVALTAASGKEEIARVQRRLTQGGGVQQNGKKKGVRVMDMRQAADEDLGPEIKLLYITPERLAKSKSIVGTFTTMNNAGRLARFVIDESHCASQLGHDFRPDYKKLSILRNLYPSVPIVALTATCPPRVLADVLQILQLRPTCDGKAATPRSTVLFTAPLYRPNLRYSVLAKPTSANGVIQTMADWILEHHPSDTGIIYCLSQKDTETVAAALRTASENQIKTGVYHAGLDDAEKERVHNKWRDKKIRVVCATIAFGLGIDIPSVRFVLHHTLSKSLEGLYQESGRAGRDGQPSDCVLFYRHQDATRLSGMMYGERDAMTKLHDMLSYARDLRTCRKLLFSRYFADKSTTSFSGDADTPCSHCDNCLRDASSYEIRDARVDAWRVLRILEAVRKVDGRVTLAQLGDLCRGLGGGSFSTAGTGKKQVAGKETIDVAAVAGAKIAFSKEVEVAQDTESLIMELMLGKYIADLLIGNAYSVLAYLQLGKNAIRLSRLGLKDLERGEGPQIELVTLRKGKAKKTSKAASEGGTTKAKRKRATKAVPSLAEDEDNGEGFYFNDDDHDDDDLPDAAGAAVLRDFEAEEEEEGAGDDWEDVTPALPGPSKPKKAKTVTTIELSD